MFKRSDDDGTLRIGFVISKKIGGSVLRNKIKRVIKEILRKSDIKILNGLDILFIIRKDIDVFNPGELKKGLENNLVSFLTGQS